MRIDLLSIISIVFFCITFVPVSLVMLGTALTIVGVL